MCCTINLPNRHNIFENKDNYVLTNHVYKKAIPRHNNHKRNVKNHIILTGPRDLTICHMAIKRDLESLPKPDDYNYMIIIIVS